MRVRPDQLRVGIDLSSLQRGLNPDQLGQMVVTFVYGLTRHAPEVDFIVLTRIDEGNALAHLDAANVRRLGVPVSNGWEGLIRRLDARVPWRHRRERLTRRFAWPKSLRQAYSNVRRGVLRRSQAHVVFCPFTNSGVRDPSVPLVSAIHDLQHLSHPHLLTSSERAVRARAFATTSRSAHRIVCSTTAVRDVALGSNMLAADRVLTVAPRRLLEPPAASTAEVATVLAPYGLREKSFLLFPGDFEPRHNHPVVLTALGLFRARHPDSTLKVVFDGSPNARLASFRTTVEQMGLESSVQFVSTQRPEERTALIQSCRAVLVPSLYETIGETVIGAMALGRPIVCSRVSGLAELTGGAMLPFEPHQPADLAAALERTEYEPGLLDRLVQHGRKRVAMLDDAQTVAQAYISVFREAQKSCLAFR